MTDHNGQVDPGILEYVTVFSREPNLRTNGQPRINIRTVTGTTGDLQTLMQQTFGSSRTGRDFVESWLADCRRSRARPWRFSRRRNRNFSKPDSILPTQQNDFG